MLFFGILSILLAVAAAEETCYNEVESICKGSRLVDNTNSKCNAAHGQIGNLQASLQQYANYNLVTSYHYLLMSSYFGNYEAHREGFKALYRKLSDKSWEDTISVLKYLGKRGGRADCNQFPSHAKEVTILDLDEIKSLPKALQMQKDLHGEALRIHSKALHEEKNVHQDAGLMHYLQEQFIEPQTERIRDLAGYTTDMKGIVATQDASIGVFLFDEYLKKSL